MELTSRGVDLWPIERIRTWRSDPDRIAATRAPARRCAGRACPATPLAISRRPVCGYGMLPPGRSEAPGAAAWQG